MGGVIFCEYRLLLHHTTHTQSPGPVPRDQAQNALCSPFKAPSPNDFKVNRRCLHQTHLYVWSTLMTSHPTPPYPVSHWHCVMSHHAIIPVKLSPFVLQARPQLPYLSHALVSIGAEFLQENGVPHRQRIKSPIVSVCLCYIRTEYYSTFGVQAAAVPDL